MLHDFHTHTFNSDGILSPVELIRYAVINGYATIGITDHVAIGSLERIIKEVTLDCELARKHWDIIAMPGVELTHIPPETINDMARRAKELGAWIVVVHGETSTEPVPEGTNLAAIQSPYVDILAHPGYLTLEEAKLAAQNGHYIELSARKGHSATNRHVAQVCLATGAKLLVNSDTHSDLDLLTAATVETILTDAGVPNDQFNRILSENALELKDRILRAHKLL
ncbi:MAG TPA: PHP domain-containing protein [Dehalococcoidia bacterium]|nr:PHP domain-containing protein [Dehalococcoidia bacterium]